jgi:catechol 2,3-dioxygenase-like lactoylglutathione lyase family enzyme
MIQKMSHATIYVLDQDQAKDFYVDKLGFELKADYTAPNGFRWLTVVPKGQSEFEIALLKVGSAAPPESNGGETAKKDIDAMAALLKKGWLSTGAFQTADCRKTSAELKAKGVEFVSEPKDEFWGITAVIKDPFGNYFSMTQPKNQ